NIIADFIALFTPHFEIFPKTSLSAGYDNLLTQRLIEVLKQNHTEESSSALLRLCTAESTEKIHPLLKEAYKMQQRQRQNVPLTVREVVKILKQSMPANARDLWALTLDKLEDVINNIEKSNTNDYQFYWDNSKTEERRPRDEDI